MRSAALEAVLSDFSTLVTPASRLERPAAPTVPCGIAAVDELTGGLPRGCLTEICGPASSGRTTLMLAALAEATTRGEVCALIDSSDCFDPLSAQQAGVDLERLLWVRCQQSAASTKRNPPQTHRGTEETGDETLRRGSTWRVDQKHLAFGIQHSAKQSDDSRGTPLKKEKETRFINSGMKNCGSRGVHTQSYSGMPDIPEINVLTRPEQRYRDINKLKQGDYSDPGCGPGKFPPQRHGDTEERSVFSSEPSVTANHRFSRISTDRAHDEPLHRTSSMINADFKSEIRNQKSEIEALQENANFELNFRYSRLSPGARAELARLEQALKVADLLLQSGGFGVIALDLGNISIRSARRVPLTSWFRFRRAVENTATVLLVLEREAHARSCASLVLQLGQASAIGTQQAGRAIPPQRHRDTEEVTERALRAEWKPTGADFKSENQNSEIETPSHVELLTGLNTCAEIARGERKGAGSVCAEFASQSAWAIG